MERANHSGGVRKVHGKTSWAVKKQIWGRERRREKPSNPRTTTGSQEMEDTASTTPPRPPRGLDGHPTRGAFGLARTQRKVAGGHLQSRILKSLYT